MYRLLFQGIVTVIVLVILAQSAYSFAQVRSSSNFQIERDAISVGGMYSTSSSYRVNDTVGQVSSGQSTSSSYLLQAGFQQQPEVTLTLSGGAAVVMDAAIGGVTGGSSVGSTSVNASTDGAAGYQLTIAASQSPAMQSTSASIADYTPAGVVPDANFTTSATDAHFGFSPFGSDIVDRYRISGGVCGSGVASSTACWDGLSTTARVIASAPGANAPAGATTTIYFQVGIGGSVIQPPGTYVATTTITLLSL